MTQLPLLSDLPVRPPGGTIALGPPMAQHGPEVSYAEIPVRRILCPSKGASKGAGKGGYPSWTINPYRGCEIGCTYCYARYTHTYLGRDDPRAFEREIFVKTAAPQRVVRDLRPEHFKDGGEIAIGTATDPYQPAERRFRITRGILEHLEPFTGLHLSITTKSPLILDDLDLLRRIAQRSRLTVHISLITLDADLARRLEPKAATPAKRLDTIHALSQAGIRVGLFQMPILPGINDEPRQMAAVERTARAAGAAFVCTGGLSLRRAAWPVFAQMLSREFPHLHDDYARRAATATRN